MIGCFRKGFRTNGLKLRSWCSAGKSHLQWTRKGYRESYGNGNRINYELFYKHCCRTRYDFSATEHEIHSDNNTDACY